MGCVAKIVSDGVINQDTMNSECTRKINAMFSVNLDSTTAGLWTSFGAKLGEDYVFEKNNGTFDRLSGDDLKYAKFPYLYETVRYCYEYGFCYCNDRAQYLRPEGDIAQGKIGATCQTCPDTGTICSGEMPILATKCCLAPGNFNDTTGNGQYTNNCYYDGMPWD